MGITTNLLFIVLRTCCHTIFQLMYYGKIIFPVEHGVVMKLL